MVMIILLAVCAYVFFNGGLFSKQAEACRLELATKAMNDVTTNKDWDTISEDYVKFLETGKSSPDMKRFISLAENQAAARSAEIKESMDRWGLKQPQAEKKSKADMQFEEKIEKLEAPVTIGSKFLQGYRIETGAKVSSQTFQTIFNQMRVPMALRTLLPIGITGLFCALCVFLLISSDTTYLHSWGSIIVQDVILPITGRPLTPRQQLFMLRIIIATVACFSFIFSTFFGQVDYILMFFAITGAIWMGGAGPCIVLGLYWKRGTASGAFTALTVGSSISVLGIILQKWWEPNIYPWLESQELVGTVAVWLQSLSAPFNPYIQWEMSPIKFPINSQEIFFFAMVLSISLYVVISLLTCKEPFNMDRMLHRGEYHREGKKLIQEKLTWRNAFQKLLGIDSQYTLGDKIIAWSVFCYSIGWNFLIMFVGIVIWNTISPWPEEWWGTYYFILYVVVSGLLVASVSTVWFTIGGTRDLLRMFKDLAAKHVDILDDGRVVGNVSADDVVMVEKIEHVTIEEAHEAEAELAEELRQETEEDR